VKNHFQTKTQELTFIGIVLLAFVAFYIETDIYTPSFPSMVSFFSATENSIQLLISMNFLGLCLSSLFFGPASDAYGRKSILCTGLCIFMVGSLGCSLTTSFDWMVGYRLLQGLGCGAIVSAGLAMFFDVFDPEKSARLVSVCNGTLGGLMALAPIVGNIISLQYGWRANFYLIAILSTASFLLFVLCVKETLPLEKRVPLSIGNVLSNYVSLLRNFPFMAYNIIWCLMFSVVLIFIANLSLIYVDYLNVSKEIFGYYQAAIMGAFFIGSMCGAYCIKKWGMSATKMLGNVNFLLGILSLGLLSFASIESPLLLIVGMSLASLGSALAITIYFTDSMGYIGDHLKGSAMSLTQSMRLLISSGLIWIAAYHFDGTTKPISLISILCSAFCILLYVMLRQCKMHCAEQKIPV
jgi:DHA1 family bicyclomycin/chloramphenicol resistance-like MFS transporter